MADPDTGSSLVCNTSMSTLIAVARGADGRAWMTECAKVKVIGV